MTNNIAVYDEFRSQLSTIKAENESIVFDYEDPKDNKAARSHIYKLRQTKSAVEKARKQEKAASLEYGRAVDAQAKEIVGEIESMIDVHQKPISEIEQREKDRIEKHQNHIEGMREVANQSEHPDGVQLNSAEYQQALSYLESIKIDDSWDEFVAEAAKTKDDCIATVKQKLDSRLKYEAEQEELSRLRKEAEEREQKEREEAIAREAEERAKKVAEESAKREKELAEKRELELKLAAERAEREKQEASRRAEVAEKEAEEKAKREVEEEKARAEEESRKREENKRHCAKINNQAAKCLVDECELSEDSAKKIVKAIAQKKIKNVTIHY